MIRINLVPAKKKASRGPALGVSRPGSGQIFLLATVIVWVGLMGIGWWLLTEEEEAADALRRQAAAVNKQAEAIKQEIDEEGLRQREAQVEQMEIAIKKLTAKRRTPVYVMYELAMILTDAKDGGGPDIDEEKQRQILKADPQSQINDRWDPTGLWITSIKENGGVLAMEGAARDAADLSEFTRRLRASARFGELSHPDFQRVGDAKSSGARHLEWKLNVAVRRWD